MFLKKFSCVVLWIALVSIILSFIGMIVSEWMSIYEMTWLVNIQRNVYMLALTSGCLSVILSLYRIRKD